MPIFKRLFKNTKKQQIKNLIAQVQDLKKEVEELSQRDDNSRDELIAGLNDRLESVEEKTEVLDSYSLEDIYYDLDTAKYNIDDFDSRIYDLENNDTSELNDRVDDLETTTENQNDKIDALDERITDLEYGSTFNGNDDELNAKLNEFNARIVALEDSEKVAQIADIKQSLKDLFTKVLKALED